MPRAVAAARIRKDPQVAEGRAHSGQGEIGLALASARREIGLALASAHLQQALLKGAQASLKLGERLLGRGEPVCQDGVAGRLDLGVFRQNVASDQHRVVIVKRLHPVAEPFDQGAVREGLRIREGIARPAGQRGQGDVPGRPGAVAPLLHRVEVVVGDERVLDRLERPRRIGRQRRVGLPKDGEGVVVKPKKICGPCSFVRSATSMSRPLAHFPPSRHPSWWSVT